jgi:hypothetical protein
MTISGFLPRRWRTTPDVARHAEAIAGVLHTAPIEPSGAGPMVASLLGTADVLPYLVAIKSFHGGLARGRIAIVDDGTLTGEDRAILAYHCGDPEIIPHKAVPRGPFPTGAAWALLLTMLDRRAGQYWIALDSRTTTLADLPEVKAAIAGNRSLAVTGGEASVGPARRLDRRVAALAGTRGWRYRPGCAGLVGFAAGGAGRALATAILGELAALAEPATAETARNLLLANEAEPVWLPPQAYCVHGPKVGEQDPVFRYYPRGPRCGEAYSLASRTAVSRLAQLRSPPVNHGPSP